MFVIEKVMIPEFANILNHIVFVQYSEPRFCFWCIFSLSFLSQEDHLSLKLSYRHKSNFVGNFLHDWSLKAFDCNIWKQEYRSTFYPNSLHLSWIESTHQNNRNLQLQTCKFYVKKLLCSSKNECQNCNTYF